MLLRCRSSRTELWGEHLAEELPRIYARESVAAVVVFVSADYAGGDWTRLERRATFSRAVAEAGVYVLPARFGDSEMPGLLPDVVLPSTCGAIPSGQFANLVVEKLAELGNRPSSGVGGRQEAARRSPGRRSRPAAAGCACGDQRARSAR